MYDSKTPSYSLTLLNATAAMRSLPSDSTGGDSVSSKSNTDREKPKMLEGKIYIVGDDVKGRCSEVFSAKCLAFLFALHEKFQPRRLQLLQERISTQNSINKTGVLPSVNDITYQNVRTDTLWKARPIPDDLQHRWVEMTGPVESKQLLTGLNSPANCYMGDFEDATSPSWENIISGHLNVQAAISRTLSFQDPRTGKNRTLSSKTATLIIRPRGLHLEERHLRVLGENFSASFLDIALYYFLNHSSWSQSPPSSSPSPSPREYPRLYIPKIESYKEAELWSDVIEFSEEYLGVQKYSSKVTVLVETISGALQIEEILFALRNYICGMNAGRWDYLFSILKKFQSSRSAILADRSQLTMETPFMRSYCEKLVSICHKRGVLAIGGMAAQLPSKTAAGSSDGGVLEVILKDKRREISMGFDGTWVAHPDFIKPVGELFENFFRSSKGRNQMEKVPVCPADALLLRFDMPNAVSLQGVKDNIDACLQYLAFWIMQRGAVAIHAKMEDAATAEISRSQLWIWLRFNVPFSCSLEEWKKIGLDSCSAVEKVEANKGYVTFTKSVYLHLKHHIYTQLQNDPKFLCKKSLPMAATVLDKLVLSPVLYEFLTTIAYEFLYDNKHIARL